MGTPDLQASLDFLRASPDYVILDEWPGLTDSVVDLRYGSANNFSGEDQFGPLKKCYLHREAAVKLVAARVLLSKLAPKLRFYVFDALRPRSVQWRLWKFVVNTPEEKYLANPEAGSIHNYGLALDLSLADPQGRELDLGTPFDTFNDLAEPQHEERLLNEGRLKREHVERRELLRAVMSGAGFIGVPHEWWHFEALPRGEVRARFQIVE